MSLEVIFESDYNDIFKIHPGIKIEVQKAGPIDGQGEIFPFVIPSNQRRYTRLISKYLRFYETIRDVLDQEGNIIMPEGSVFLRVSSAQHHQVYPFNSVDEYKFFIRSDLHDASMNNLTFEEYSDLIDAMNQIKSLYE